MKKVVGEPEFGKVVVGDDPKAKLFKNAFFEGANAGIGHEPNRGVTEVEILWASLRQP